MSEEIFDIFGKTVVKLSLDKDTINFFYAESVKDFDSINENDLITGQDKSIFGPGYQFWQSYNKLNKLLEEKYKFYLSNKIDIDTLSVKNWLLIQTDESWINNDIHDHVSNFAEPARKVIVTYLNCNYNDSILFYGRDPKKFQEYELPVSTGDVLLFDADLRHRPKPCDKKYYKNLRVTYTSDLFFNYKKNTDDFKKEICLSCPSHQKDFDICLETEDLTHMMLQKKITCPLGKWE